MAEGQHAEGLPEFAGEEKQPVQEEWEQRERSAEQGLADELLV